VAPATCFMAEPRGVFLSASFSVESWIPSLLLDFYLGSSVDASRNFLGCYAKKRRLWSVKWDWISLFFFPGEPNLGVDFPPRGVFSLSSLYFVGEGLKAASLRTDFLSSIFITSWTIPYFIR
jgi:hypothetical protein